MMYTLMKHISVSVFLYSGHDDPSKVIASARSTTICQRSIHISYPHRPNVRHDLTGSQMLYLSHVAYLSEFNSSNIIKIF